MGKPVSEQQIEQAQAEIELLTEMIDALVATVGEAMAFCAEDLDAAMNGQTADVGQGEKG